MENDVQTVVAKDAMSAMVKLATQIEESVSDIIDYSMVSQSTAKCGEQCSISYFGQLIARCKLMACVRREGGPHDEVDANFRVDETAQETTFRSAKGGNAPSSVPCPCTLNRYATRFTVVKCPMRCLSVGGHHGWHGPKDSCVGERGAD